MVLPARHVDVPHHHHHLPAQLVGEGTVARIETEPQCRNGTEIVGVRSSSENDCSVCQ